MKRKHKDERLSEMLHIRLTPIQKAALERAATAAGMDPGAYARRLLVSLLGAEMKAIFQDRIAASTKNDSKNGGV